MVRDTVRDLHRLACSVTQCYLDAAANALVLVILSTCALNVPAESRSAMPFPFLGVDGR